MSQQIGTVTLLRDRVYMEYSVPAGVYPIIKIGNLIRFRFTGYRIQPAHNDVEPIDDMPGCFTLSRRPDKVLPGDPVQFDGPTYWTEEEFQVFLQSLLCVEGHTDQRLRIERWNV